MLEWAREGIQDLGGRAAWRSLGTSGFQVAIKGAKHPFKWIEMTVLLESREMHLVWLFNHLRGRRDLMLLKADLRTGPKTEVEIVPKKGRITRKILNAIEEENWARGEIEGTNLMVLRKGKDMAGWAERLAPLLREHAHYVLRISLRKRSPHLLANFSLSGLERVPAEETFGLLKEIVKMASSGAR